MEDHVYRLSEVVGTSSEGIDQAIRNAVARANQTLRNLDWFQVSEIRGVISGGEVTQAGVPPGGVTGLANPGPSPWVLVTPPMREIEAVVAFLERHLKS
jgi:flavin-binding protein dodecin